MYRQIYIYMYYSLISVGAVGLSSVADTSVIAVINQIL